MLVRIGPGVSRVRRWQYTVSPILHPQVPAHPFELSFPRSNATMKALPVVVDGQPATSGLHTPRSGLQSGSSTPDLSSFSASARSSLDGSQPRALRSPAGPATDQDDPRHTILQSFPPKICVYASADTEELVRLKGIYGGFCGLLRPFGEHVQGNVVVRDSVGASKSWTNFGVHFVYFGRDGSLPSWTNPLAGSVQRAPADGQERDWSQVLKGSPQEQTTNASAVDQVMDHYLHREERALATSKSDPAQPASITGKTTPAYYTYYLRKLLAGRPTVPHETFTHPVACLIAISSQCPSPIDTLRDLYNDTRQESRNLPPWVGNDFLRYYVLVHDEDNDDITKSTALFNQMKRHFGLHCHLLRIRSLECGPDDRDCVPLPTCRWLSAEEELADIRQKGNSPTESTTQVSKRITLEQNQGIDEFQQFLFDTDLAVIRTFVREMVTQSVVPFMEGKVTKWNDQVASRRRGLSGRFMSLSKRWTPFSSGKGPKSSSSSASSTSGSNYNATQGFYTTESPELIMHRLADYAFMLRDWRLCSSTYDLLRTDFGDDKAWNHHAVAHEMTALSLLLGAQSSSTRPRGEVIDQLLDTASYSYISRCSSPQSAVRCLLLAVELYRSCGSSSLEEAAKWGDRLLELAIMSSLTQGLLVERLAICYAPRPGVGISQWGSRNRKYALWNLLASDTWLHRSRPVNAKIRLLDAGEAYGLTRPECELPLAMHEFWRQMQANVVDKIQAVGYMGVATKGIAESNLIDVEREDLDDVTRFKKQNNRLSMGLQPTKPEQIYSRLRDDSANDSEGFA